MLSLRRTLHEPGFHVGTWIALSDPAAVEIATGSALDFVVIDTEHGAIGPETLERMLLGARGGRARVLVRVGSNEPIRIMQALDGGADGIVVPRVATGDEARRAIEWVRYPPEGHRGFGPRRAGGYGRHVAEYVAAADSGMAAVVQIERREAIDALESICDVEGLDALLIGPNDLAGSLGVPRQLEHPLVQEAIEQICRVAVAKGVPVGIASESVAPNAESWVRLGMSFAVVDGDYAMLAREIDRLVLSVAQATGSSN